MYMEEPCTALFVTLTAAEKTHLALDLLQRDHLGYFDYIIILCTTLRYNETYQ